MHKRARELDEALVKTPIGAVTIRQPQIFEHIVRLVKKLAVETVEIAEVMGVQFLSLEGLNHGGNTGAFVTHEFRLKRRSRGDETHSERKNERLPTSPPTFLLGDEPKETAAVCRRKNDLILQVGEIKRKRVRQRDPIHRC
jgi:hypothetical protein